MLFSPHAADDSDRVRVTVVGLTQEDAILQAVANGADAIGFSCYPASPRFVTPSRLTALATMVAESVSIILVFVNPKAELVREYLQVLPNAILHFQGQESRAFCDQFHVPYIKAVAMDTPERLLQAQDEYPMAQALVAQPLQFEYGRKEHAFDWEALKTVRAQVRKPLIITGDLHPNNIAEAIQLTRPWGVDVVANEHLPALMDVLDTQPYAQVSTERGKA